MVKLDIVVAKIYRLMEHERKFSINYKKAKILAGMIKDIKNDSKRMKNIIFHIKDTTIEESPPI